MWCALSVKTAARESESNDTKQKDSYSHKHHPVSRLNVFKRFAVRLSILGVHLAHFVIRLIILGVHLARFAIRLIILGVHFARFARAQQEGYADTLCTS